MNACEKYSCGVMCGCLIATAEERAASYQRYAKKLVGNGQTDKAKERLQEIVRDLPRTEAATEARQLLEKLMP